MLCTVASFCAYKLHAVSLVATWCNHTSASAWWHDETCGIAFPAVIQGQLNQLCVAHKNLIGTALFGHDYLQSIGDGDDTVESSSAELMQTAEGFAPVFFDPRPLTNLLLIDELDSLSPVLDMQVFCCLLASLLLFLSCYQFMHVMSLESSKHSLYTVTLSLASTAATALSTLYSEADSATSCVLLTSPEAAV